MKKRRALLIANAPSATLPRDFRRMPDDLIIAVDGGAIHAQRWGWLPHMVVGDLDSLPTKSRTYLESQSVRFLTASARKDETDLELAIKVAVQEGANTLIIFAALGGWVDQMLANILLLDLPARQGITAFIVEGRQSLHLICGGETATFSGRPGDTLSLIPVAGDAVGVTTTHLEYALHDETLFFGPTRGVSNVFTGSEAQVRLREGRLLAVHIRRT
jgi:thiamine pyrophosphokinase